MSTKVHAACDARGRPTAFVLTPGQASDLSGADELLPRIASGTVIGDRGYDADATIAYVERELRATATIPPHPNRAAPRACDYAA